jgi:hypothetical protein
MEAVIVSEAVIVWGDAVLNVTVKVPVPFASVESGGRTAWLSVLAK